MSKKGFCLLVFLAALVTCAVPSLAQLSAENFEIDDTKPYVYIKFDHIGERRPVTGRETISGLWLRLVNNCRLPISITALDPGTGDPGAILNYEVVPIGGRKAPDSEQRRKMPIGYASDLGTLVIIPPKGDFLFSVPAESVSEHWFIRVRFRFVLPAPKSIPDQPAGYEPYSLVDFQWYTIPERFRRPSPPAGSGGEARAATEDAEGALPHEGSHADSADRSEEAGRSGKHK